MDIDMDVDMENIGSVHIVSRIQTRYELREQVLCSGGDIRILKTIFNNVIYIYTHIYIRIYIHSIRTQFIFYRHATREVLARYGPYMQARR